MDRSRRRRRLTEGVAELFEPRRPGTSNLARAPSDVLSYQLRSTSDVLLCFPRPRESARSLPRSPCLQFVPSMDDTSTEALYSSR